MYSHVFVHAEVLTVLLQVFDEGRLTDSDSRKQTVNCKKAVFVMTSNLGNDMIAAHSTQLRAEADSRARALAASSNTAAGLELVGLTWLLHSSTALILIQNSIIILFNSYGYVSFQSTNRNRTRVQRPSYQTCPLCMRLQYFYYVLLQYDT